MASRRAQASVTMGTIRQGRQGASARAVYSPHLCIIVIRVSGNSRETYVKTNKLPHELTHGDREIDADVKRWIFSPKLAERQVEGLGVRESNREARYSAHVR